MQEDKFRFSDSFFRRQAKSALSISMGCLVLLTAILSVGSKPVSAHPHAWIDLRSSVILDENGHVIAIEQEWLFDDFYTVFATDQIGTNEKGQAAALRELAKANLDNLRLHDYFTEIRVDESVVSPGTVTEYQSEIRNGRLWLRFVLPIPEAVDASINNLSFAVYDPTYYVEILHLEGDVISFRGPAEHACFGMIKPPTPTTESVMLAQALDRDIKPDNTLGRMFAEQVDVTCKK